MGLLNRLMVAQDWRYFSALVLSVLPCLWFILLQGVVSSRVAFRLGDPTPKLNGGFKFHPMIHVDPLGLLLFVTTGLGWGNWIPLKPSNLKNKQADSFVIWLSGALACLVSALLSLLLASFLQSLTASPFWSLVIWYFANTAVLGISFVIFNCLPLPYFCAFRVIYPFLNGTIQEKLNKYHPHCSLVFIVLLWSGMLQAPLLKLMQVVLNFFCTLFGFPFSFVTYHFL